MSVGTAAFTVLSVAYIAQYDFGLSRQGIRTPAVVVAVVIAAFREGRPDDRRRGSRRECLARSRRSPRHGTLREGLACSPLRRDPTCARHLRGPQMSDDLIDRLSRPGGPVRIAAVIASDRRFAYFGTAAFALWPLLLDQKSSSGHAVEPQAHG
jgi:hypothetical protein